MWFVLEHRLKEEGKKHRLGSNKCLQQVRWICCEAASTLFLSAYPFSRRYSQTVFVSVEATDLADLSDEVDVFLVLRLLTLASLVFSTEVEETAGEDKVAAGIRRPIIWKRRDKINLHSADHYSLIQSDYRGLVLLKHFSIFNSNCSDRKRHTHTHTLQEIIICSLKQGEIWLLTLRLNIAIRWPSQ